MEAAPAAPATADRAAAAAPAGVAPPILPPNHPPVRAPPAAARCPFRRGSGGAAQAAVRPALDAAAPPGPVPVPAWQWLASHVEAQCPGAADADGAATGLCGWTRVFHAQRSGVYATSSTPFYVSAVMAASLLLLLGSFVVRWAAAAMAPPRCDHCRPARRRRARAARADSGGHHHHHARPLAPQTDAAAEAVVLYARGGPETSGPFANASPASLMVETYLRVTNIPYVWRAMDGAGGADAGCCMRCARSGRRDEPMALDDEAVPVAAVHGHLYCGVDAILAALRVAAIADATAGDAGDGVPTDPATTSAATDAAALDAFGRWMPETPPDLDRLLTPAQRSRAVAYRALAERALWPHAAYFRWVPRPNFRGAARRAVTQTPRAAAATAWLSAVSPWAWWAVVKARVAPWLVRRRVRRTGSRASHLRLGRRALHALADAIAGGSGSGGMDPAAGVTTADCAVFAVLAQILLVDAAVLKDDPLGAYVRDACPALVRYVQAMATAYFPEAFQQTAAPAWMTASPAAAASSRSPSRSPTTTRAAAADALSLDDDDDALTSETVDDDDDEAVLVSNAVSSPRLRSSTATSRASDSSAGSGRRRRSQRKKR
ncbi:hypothetical protein CXG81DRAFT_27047 [Caulochytrium protostelioides]|uniref:Metaxin glutathione S-transferase domain-containing protein n=1 Tax=Caulochytrium protostelioides TaxID=1555241 RepID=A0A4P9X529_9FUNG|nr:hypothetical protein CXG81DRAFT_27047 [Caulochytrium protostelioides]|eukprot:RKP00227.1 hypothetical protein CXG81DRAFT_27047 [Caulochytrium protostelioides]